MIVYKNPVLFVDDLRACETFYHELLGQAIRLSLDTCVFFESGFFINERTDISNSIYGDSSKLEGKDGGFEIYFEDDDMSATLAKLKEHSVEFIHEIKTESWHQQTMRFYDPQGNIVEIGEPFRVTITRLMSEGKSIDEVAEMIGRRSEQVVSILEGCEE